MTLTRADIRGALVGALCFLVVAVLPPVLMAL